MVFTAITRSISAKARVTSEKYGPREPVAEGQIPLEETEDGGEERRPRAMPSHGVSPARRRSSVEV